MFDIFYNMFIKEKKYNNLILIKKIMHSVKLVAKKLKTLISYIMHNRSTSHHSTLCCVNLCASNTKITYPPPKPSKLFEVASQ